MLLLGGGLDGVVEAWEFLEEFLECTGQGLEILACGQGWDGGAGQAAEGEGAVRIASSPQHPHSDHLRSLTNIEGTNFFRED